ncbi:MAG: TatD family hydrolase [Christensenellales bacterium]|jgi:TatD DNase family protein
MAMLFDTHAHLLDRRFDRDREGLIAGLAQRGVGLVVNVGCERKEFDPCLELARRYDFIHTAVGVHPHYAKDFSPGDLDWIREARAAGELVALGEIGLDYHYDFSPRDVQKKCFEQQMQCANELEMPVILHVREAFGDMMPLLRRYKAPYGGVLHCFSGSLEIALECVALGFHISFAGPLTFEKSVKLRRVASNLPKERVLIETDCPYLAPVPMRGKRNDPGLVYYVARELAALWEMQTEQAIEITQRNGRELFRMGEGLN